jgi:hypothetical protein
MQTRNVGYAYNPEPADDPSEAWRETRRGELRADLTYISEWLTECPLLAHSDSWKHTNTNGTTYVHPAVTTGAATLRALMDGSDADALAAVKALREYVNEKIGEQAVEDWDDFVAEGWS